VGWGEKRVPHAAWEMGDGRWEYNKPGSFKNPAFPVLIGRTYRKINLRIKMQKHEVLASKCKGECKLCTTYYYYYY
jgi:hypothetical protein